MNAEELEDLVCDYISRCESGERLDPDTFAREHPAAGPELLAALRRVATTQSLFPAARDAGLPDRVGPYRVLAEIGRGGTGRVLEVERDGQPGELLALKLLTSAAALNPRSIERLRREGEVLRRLRHPGIVSVHEIGECEGAPYLVIDRLRGDSLATVVRAAVPPTSGPRCAGLVAPLSAPEGIARVGAQIARAVAAAHAAGLLHRDLKPGNVILTEGGAPVLIDFGLAAGDAGPTLTKTGDVLGTPHYMAPEQARGEHATERSDVYGIGAIVYELLVLEPPHRGADSVAVLDAVRHRPIARLRRLDPEIPRALETIVRRAMAFDPARRYSGAEPLALDLEAFVAARPIRARPPGIGECLADALRFNGKALAFGSAAVVILVLAGLLLLAMLPSSAARRDAAVARAATAWASGVKTDVAEAGREILALQPGDELGALLVSFGGGDSLPEASDPAVGDLSDGLRALTARDFAAAVGPLKRAAVAMPGSPLAAILLGEAARGAREFAVADVQLSTAVRLLPDSADAHRLLGRVYRQQKRFAEAEPVLRRACDLDDSDSRNWEGLARVFLEVKRFEPGLHAIDRAIATSERPSVRMRKIRGLMLEGLERWPEAREIWRALIDERPGDSFAWERFAWSFDSLHQMFEAEKEYRLLIERKPRNPLGPMSLSYLYSGSNRAECAECRAFFEANPSYYRPQEAETWACAALQLEGGDVSAVVNTAVRVAKNIGGSAAIREAVRVRLDRAHQAGDDDSILRLSKALNELSQ